jgi:hypothetical protein
MKKVEKDALIDTRLEDVAAEFRRLGNDANYMGGLREPCNARGLHHMMEMSAYLSIALFGNPNAKKTAIEILEGAGINIIPRKHRGSDKSRRI